MRLQNLVSVALLLVCIRAHSPERQSFSIPDVSPGNYHNSAAQSAAYSTLSVNNTDPLHVAQAHVKYLAPNATFRLNGDHYTSKGSEITHVYFTQTLDGLDIVNAHANVNVKKDGTVLSIGISFLLGELNAAPITRRQQLLKPVDALKGAIKAQGYPMSADEATVKPQSSMVGGNSQSYVIDGTMGALSSPKADLVYYATKDGPKLSWKLETDLGNNWMITFADAQTEGTVHGAVDYVADATYKVYEFSKVNDPTEGDRKDISDPFNKDASPKGWQVAGDHEYTTTQGNNAIAQDNPDGGDSYVNNHRPDGGKDENFDYPYDINAQDPKSYRDASITQLYYTTNMFHDLLEELGFDEAAGNFEEVDTKQGGKGGDAVQVNAQDGGGMNNANFGTPPDGERPRMNMFLWDIVDGPMRDGAFDQSIVTHEYTHGLSTRLTGGPASGICLDSIEAGGMGEGWSDFYATAIRIKQTDTRDTDYIMGDWVAGQGIRPYPYSTSTSTNPTTYATLNEPDYSEEPHQIGAVWAEILYEVMWNLNDKWGYSENVFPEYREGTQIPTKGRQLAMKLVLDGMKLQPCKPTLLNARDAIIDADKALTAGENQCELWAGFAKRGLGADAQQGSGDGQRVNGFSLPSDLNCPGQLQPGNNSQGIYPPEQHGSHNENHNTNSNSNGPPAPKKGERQGHTPRSR